MHDGLVVEEVCGDDNLDDLLQEVRAENLVGDVLVVLGGDDNGVHALGDARTMVQSVLNGDLFNEHLEHLLQCTWDLQSGRRYPIVPSRRSSAIFSHRRWARMQVMGISSGVSLQA